MSASAAAVQRVEAAVDIGEMRTLTVQCRKPIAAASGTLRLQTSMTNEDAGYVDVTSSTFDLGTTTTEVAVFTDLLRFVRWKVDSVTGASAAHFMLDVVARKA